MPCRRWSELPRDLVGEISARLQVAADFVIFHAVCKPWRDAHSRHPAETTRNQFLLPWLLDPAEMPYFPLKLRCVFSKSSYRVPRPPPYEWRRNWVASADGTALWYMTVQLRLPTLHDPLTGAVTHLTRLPRYVDRDLEVSPSGIVYGDGTILLYTVSSPDGPMVTFSAALLCPGDARWTLVHKNLPATGRHGQLCVAYHGGRIIVTRADGLWRVAAPDCPFLVPRPLTMQGNCTDDCSYVLESRGELLWASVQVRWSHSHRIGGRRVGSFTVLVHALEEETSRWVRKDGRSLADRVLFLGSPNSFALDASRLGDQGGSAYFAFYTGEATMTPLEKFGVFCYSFSDSNTKFVEPLMPRLWDDDKCMWLIPQPTIAPVQEINKTKQVEAQKRKKQLTATINHPTRIIQMERHYEHSFRLLVRNLPLNVKGSQLHRFFSKHGKVYSAEIIYYKKTKTSQGLGLVTMATMHVHKDDVLAALDGLVLDGCPLEVIFVNDGQRRRRRADRVREQSRYMQICPGRG